MKVKEVMAKKITSLSPETNAKEALELLEKMQISGLPVIDGENKLVGMFTEKSILRHVLPSYIKNVGRFVYEENPKSVKAKLIELDKLTVSQLMRKDVVTTSEDVTLCEAARIMLTQNARRLPVLDKSGKMVGIIARCDILKALYIESKVL